ncbi:MAG: septal ring lytic transglycosylase RlpA family protein [Bdellovibrionales bacterium]|nr:septal ring lytic transglycosylase RlpA family protein [Bdellovibrionales bacterium]
MKLVFSSQIRRHQKVIRQAVAICLLGGALYGCTTIYGSEKATKDSATMHASGTAVAPQGANGGVDRHGDRLPWKSVRASFYSNDFAGRKTANGERFSPSALTAAHRTLPFNSRVAVRNPDNGKQVTVRINDRGPFVTGRALDLSGAAAKALGILGDGVARVEMRVLERGAS